MGILKGLKGLYNVLRGTYELAHPDEAAQTYFYTEFYRDQIKEIKEKLREIGYTGDYDNIPKDVFMNAYNQCFIYNEMVLSGFLSDGFQKDKQIEAFRYACREHLDELEQLGEDYLKGKISVDIFENTRKRYYGEFLYTAYKDAKWWWTI